MRLEQELRACGYKGEVADFREWVADRFARDYPTWSDETLLHNPLEAMRFCHRIREHFGLGLQDELILRTLTNSRKHSTRSTANA